MIRLKINQKFSSLKVFKSYSLACLTVFFVACSDWLDVVPDGVATIDMAFNSRTQALKYLGTCYSYMPRTASGSDPALYGGAEIWTLRTAFFIQRFSPDGIDLANGLQNASSPLLGRWQGMYQGIRVCNTFLENIARVPDLKPLEREKWTAEIMVLKAYYHFMLVQMYGPVPLLRDNFQVESDFSTFKAEREPVDECFRYIIELIDKACEGDDLPYELEDPTIEYGRINKVIALSLKAKILITAASPLFNGNPDQTSLKNHDGTLLFNPEPDLNKWKLAMDACKEAVEACEMYGIVLYEYPNTNDQYSDTIAMDLTLRNAFSSRQSTEIIWANTQMVVTAANGGIIWMSMPKLNPDWSASNELGRWFSPPISIARMFYTDKGVPLEDDNSRNYNEIYNLRTATSDEKLYVREGRMTIDMHFDREPRFYAWLGFDGGIWYGAGRYNDKEPNELRMLGFKLDDVDACPGGGTGYLTKKYVPFEAQVSALNSVSAISYAFPIMRLSDLFLLYAEAINEYEGPTGPNSEKLFDHINAVRKRAGIPTVETSWETFTDNKKEHFKNQTGMREIIQRERMIELSFECNRFWDIRRWKTAYEIYRTPIEGWNMKVSFIDGTIQEVNIMVYSPQLLSVQNFGIRDYFWPIRNSEIDVNPNLVQNIGW